MHALILAAAISCPLCDGFTTVRTTTRVRTRTYVAAPRVVEYRIVRPRVVIREIEVPTPAPSIQQGLDDQASGDSVEVRVRTKNGRTRKVDVRNKTTGSKYRYRSN